MTTTIPQPIPCPRSDYFREESVRRVASYLDRPVFDRVTSGKAIIEKMTAPRESVIEVPEAYRWAHDHVMWVVLEPGDCKHIKQGDVVQCIAEPGFGGGEMEFTNWAPTGPIAFLGTSGGGLLKVNMAAKPIWQPAPLSDQITAILDDDNNLRPFPGLVFLEYTVHDETGGVLRTDKTVEVDMVATVVAGGQWEPGTRVIADQGSVVRRVTRNEREVWAHYADGVFCEVNE